MADFSRRDFLKSASLTLMASLLPLGISPVMAETVQQGRMLFTAGTVYDAAQKENWIACRVDLATGNVRTAKMDFAAHSLCPYPGNNDRVVAMEKWGSRAAVVDFQQQAVVHNFLIEDDRTFFGHGFFSGSGDTVYMSQANYTTGNGHILGLNAQTLEIVSDHAMIGGVHDCQLGPNGTYLAACSGMKLQKDRQYSKKMADAGVSRAAPALVQIDIQDGKEVNRYPLPEDASLVHFAHTAGGMIAAAAPMKGTDKWGAHIYVGTLETGWRNVPLSDALREKLNGELLSLAIDEQNGVLALTNPTTSSVLLVDVASATIKSHVHLARGAAGIVYDEKQKAFIGTGIGGISLVFPDGTLKETQIANCHYRFHSTLV